ncbi:MAG: PAS domain S-box protein [Scytonema sp. PMC 1069.18]|nr:PAS domain S-box protein [Scytonema sp. PMC 1069.18]
MTNSTVKSLQELGLCSGKRGKSPRKVNILIVDDNPDDLLSLEHILSKLGHNLIKANSKEVALSYLLKQEFAVILLDINIPGIKEIVTDKYIKQQWKNQHTPIIFLTTFSDRQPVIFNDLTIGTVDYLYKPIVPEMLISKVSVFTNLFQKTLELAQAEEALLSCGVRLCGILDNSSDAVISVDSTQLIKIFNKEAEKIFGYTASDVLGQPLGILLLETNEKLQYIFESFHVDKSDYNTGERCEMIGRRKDGTEFPCVVSMFPLELVSGKVLTVVLRDVSDRKAAEAALRQTETNFPAFMNHSPLLCWMTDRNGKFIYCNKSFEHWYERSPSEVIGKTIFDLYPPEIAQQRLNYIKYVTSTGQVLETNESLSCPNGKSCELLIYQFPLFDTDGQTLVGGVAIDMSERKQLEEALRESERRFRAIFEQTYQLTTILKPDGTVEDANRSALESIGFFDTEVIGKPFWQTQWWKTSPEVQHRLQRAIQQAVKGKLVRYEVQVKGSDDKIATIDFSLKPLKDEFGNVTQLIAEGRDITDIKQAQQALQEANAQLNNWVKELKTRNREIALLGQLSDILQACLSIEEAHKVLARLVQPLFPDVSGAVFVLNHSDNVLEAVAMWGNASATTELIFEPKECWGLRRGRLHLTDTTSLSMACEHSKQQDSSQF